jgi:protoporphyrinogen oxidase
MKVGIIGAGFTGLAAGFRLAKAGHQVVIFEKENKPGGLASDFKDELWKWSLEKHYHHWFTSDWAIRNLAKEIGYKVVFERPKTSVFVGGESFQFDSVLSLLSFSHLSFFDRLRTGAVLFFLKAIPFWKSLEKITAKKFLIVTMGTKSWELLWKPLFVGKFGKYTEKIPASWFWARIKKRSFSLGYPVGGFGSFAESLAREIVKSKGKIFYRTSVSGISKKAEKFIITTQEANITSLEGFGALSLVLALKEKFFVDGTYWLNINEEKMPFLALVEHTNFMDRKKYAGDNILYVGNYLPPTHSYFRKTQKQLLEEFTPFLRKVNPNFEKSWVRKVWAFKVSFAQPIVSLHYSKKVLPLETPIDGLYLANIQQVYPWDRGTNYAVELGEKVSRRLLF